MPCRPDTLASTLSRHVPLSNSRRETLVVLVLGLVCGRTVNLSHIAGHFRGPAQLTSNYRRLQRFFQFVRLDEDWLARALVALLNLRPPFQLCLDRTNWKLGVKDVNLLVLCIAARRVRIPILWTVLDGSGGSSMEDRMTLMERYLAVFGVASIGMLLADREFIGNQWFEFLVKNNIPFAIRVKENLIVILEDGRMASLASLTRRRPSRRQLAAYKGWSFRRHAAALRGHALLRRQTAQRRHDDHHRHQLRAERRLGRLQKALANRMPVRRHQDTRPQHGRHQADAARQAEPAHGCCRSGPGMGACLRIRHQGPRQHRPRKPWLPSKVVVQNRLRCPATLDRQPSRQGLGPVAQYLEPPETKSLTCESRVVWPTP